MVKPDYAPPGDVPKGKGDIQSGTGGIHTCPNCGKTFQRQHTC